MIARRGAHAGKMEAAQLGAGVGQACEYKLDAWRHVRFLETEVDGEFLKGRPRASHPVQIRLAEGELVCRKVNVDLLQRWPGQKGRQDVHKPPKGGRVFSRGRLRDFDAGEIDGGLGEERVHLSHERFGRCIPASIHGQLTYAVELDVRHDRMSINLGAPLQVQTGD